MKTLPIQWNSKRFNVNVESKQILRIICRKTKRENAIDIIIVDQIYSNQCQLTVYNQLDGFCGGTVNWYRNKTNPATEKEARSALNSLAKIYGDTVFLKRIQRRS